MFGIESEKKSNRKQVSLRESKKERVENERKSKL